MIMKEQLMKKVFNVFLSILLCCIVHVASFMIYILLLKLLFFTFLTDASSGTFTTEPKIPHDDVLFFALLMDTLLISLLIIWWRQSIKIRLLAMIFSFGMVFIAIIARGIALHIEFANALKLFGYEFSYIGIGKVAIVSLLCIIPINLIVKNRLSDIRVRTLKFQE